MRRTCNVVHSLTALGLLALPVHAAGQQQETQPMGYFITSVGIGNGGDLGGLDGADAHCQSLAAAVGGASEKSQRLLDIAAFDGDVVETDRARFFCCRHGTLRAIDEHHRPSYAFRRRAWVS